MQSDVEVTVTGGLPFNEKAVQGVTITYGINAIPVARLQLDPTQVDSDFLCNTTQYKKRTPGNLVHIKINSKTGCVVFTGYFDGLNINQSSTGFEYCAVIKNQFQRLGEIYPRCVGIVPSSVLPFLAAAPLQITWNGSQPTWAPADGYSAYNDVTTQQSVASYIIDFITAVVKTHTDLNTTLVTNEDINGLYYLMNDAIYQQNVKDAVPLLEQIDTTYVDDCPILAEVCANNLINNMLGEQTDVWNMLIQSLNYIGCSAVISDSDLYIVPQVEFMLMDHGVPSFQEPAGKINCANPVEYNNLSVSDNGFANVHYCYVVVESENHVSDSTNSPILTQNIGSYPAKGSTDANTNDPDDGSSGILMVNASPFLFNSVMARLSNADIQSHVDGPNPGTKKNPTQIHTSPKPTVDARTAANTQNDANYKQQLDYLNYYAEAKFLQAKYGDRTGSLSLEFVPNWMPGTTGSVYTRTPGIFVQFYVQTVTHEIRMTAPSSGVALTNVSFSCARQGQQGDIPGVKNVDMWAYTTDKMDSLQKDWISDTTGS